MTTLSARNPDGIFINSKLFSEEAIHFVKYGHYTSAPYLSPDWVSYWTTQRERCLDGYSVGGCKITGDHYFYLNFYRMRISVQTSATTAEKQDRFPDFWDGDYNYFWSREIARKGVMTPLGASKEEVEGLINLEVHLQDEALKRYVDSLQLDYRIIPSHLRGGLNMIVAKARRKGYSHKNAAISVNNFLNRRGTLTLQMAYEKTYLFGDGIYTKTREAISFAVEHTAWKMPTDEADKIGYIKSSYAEYVNGIKVFKGFGSQVLALSFKDDSDKGRGKDCYDIFAEEGGKWGSIGGLKKSYSAMLPSVTDGAFVTGLMTIFGTSGDMEKGSVDFSEMFKSSRSYGFLTFEDIWGDSNSTEGFFHPTHYNMVGRYDDEGNSDLISAKEFELNKRAEIESAGSDPEALTRRKMEFPLNSGEAFSTSGYNIFPAAELEARIKIVRDKGLDKIKGTPVKLIETNEGVEVKRMKWKDSHVIDDYRSLPINTEGCVVIYEEPVTNAPKGLYKIGYDPVSHDDGTSFAAIIVYKGHHLGSHFKNTIVAVYVGRRNETSDIDFIAEKLAILYNTQVMYENMIQQTKNTFRRRRKLHLLALQPDKVISKNIKNSSVKRVYGCHMSKELRNAGIGYVKEWLLSVIDYNEDGLPVRVIDTINSLRLLTELLYYDIKGNFDLVSALFMCMIQKEEEELGKIYTDKRDKAIDEYRDFMSQYG